MIESLKNQNITKIDENKDYMASCSRTNVAGTFPLSLRRVLLASLPGAAVTSYQHWRFVLHGFDTVPGVREDVMQIILNIKGIAVKS